MTGFEKRFVNRDLVESYAKGRPTYPTTLFQMLASLTPQHERAWDVGTGNGQAAIGVAEHYKSVVATDVSEPQLSLAKKGHNIAYAQMSATPPAEDLERIVGPEGSIDLVTVATALQWFDVEKFYMIVKHLLRKPGGVFAAWNYDSKTMHVNPEVDAEFQRCLGLCSSFNPITRPALDRLEFPFDPVPKIEAGKGVEGHPLEIKAQRNVSFDEFMHMCRSFSNVQAAKEHGVDAFGEETEEALSRAWGPERVRTVDYTLYVLIGTVPTASVD